MPQMRWDHGRLVIRISDDAPWVDYRHTPYYLPDYPMPHGSPGYRTMQNALKMGVTYAKIENQTID